MSWNNLIDVSPRGLYGNENTDKEPTTSIRDVVGVGMDINIHQNEIDLTLYKEKQNIIKIFSKYLGHEDKENMFDCIVENEATLNLIERYLVERNNNVIVDKNTKITYDYSQEVSDVTVKLSVILTWLTLGYKPRLYKHKQIIKAYKMIRNVLEIYREDSMSLVNIEIPIIVKNKITNLMEKLETYFQDIINPSAREIDKPITTFLESRFSGLFGNDRGFVQNNGTIKNGFVMTDEDSELINEFKSNEFTLALENKWE